MSTEPEAQLRRLTVALDHHAPPVTEDELWHRLDADGTDGEPVTLLDLHRPPPPPRRAGRAVLAVAGLVAGIVGVVALVDRPTERVLGNAPATTPVTSVPPATTTSSTTTTAATPPNRPPLAVDDLVMMPAGDTSVLVDVLANDPDGDGDSLSVTDAVLLDSSVSDATLAIENGTAVRFTPSNPCTIGNYEFTYEVSDGRPGSRPATATVTLIVNANERPALLHDDVFTVTTGAVPITLTTAQLLANDVDADACHPLRITAVTGPDGTTFDGETVVLPPTVGGTKGVVTFAYTVSTGTLTSTAMVTVSVV